MHPIITRYLAPNQHRGARVSVKSGETKIYLRWNSADAEEANHRAALATFLRMTGKTPKRQARFAVGKMPDGARVFVQIRAQSTLTLDPDDRP